MTTTVHRLAAAGAAAASLVDAAWTLSLVGARVVDEDVAVYWYAAQEFAALAFREPFFYGQAYNHLAESLLAAPAVALGAPPWWATPAASALVGLAAWWVLARVAWRRGAHATAILLLGAPAILPAGYQMLLGRFFGFGVLLVTLALWTADGARAPWRWALAGALLALGAALVPNAALLVGVAVAWLAASRAVGREGWLALAAGTAAGAGLWGLGRAFYALGPAWALHPAPTLGASWANLLDGLAHLPRHLARVTPSALGHPGVLLAALGAVAAAGAWRRRWEVAAPAGVLLAGVVAGLALDKAHEATASVFFAYERMWLGLPLAVGVVAVAAAGAAFRASPPGAALVAAGVVAAAAATKWPALARDAAWERSVPQGVLDVAPVDRVLDECAGPLASADRAGAGVVVFLTNRTLAYACGALAHDRLTTLYPPYERRTWLLLDEAQRRREVLVLADVEPGAACRVVGARLAEARCEPGDGAAVVVRLPPSSALDVVRRLGIEIRRF